MKTLILMVAIMLTTTITNAQNVKVTTVPAPVKEAMKKLYPSAADIKWEKEKGNYEANFKTGTQEQSVVFDPSGVVLETEVEITERELPEAVKQYMAQHHKAEKIKETARITDAKGVVTYEVEIKGKDLLFDSNGKLLNEHE